MENHLRFASEYPDLLKLSPTSSIFCPKNAKRINRPLILYLIYAIMATLFLQKSSQGKESLTFQNVNLFPRFSLIFTIKRV